MEVFFGLMPQEVTERRSGVTGVLIWLGGGHRREVGESHERSTHAVAGAVVLLGTVLAWLIAALAITESTRWSALAVAPLSLVFALLVGALTRGTITGPHKGRARLAGRAVVAAAVGVIVGDLAALVLLSSSIDRRLDERALHTAESAPAVAQASTALARSRDARTALEGAVAQARDRQDRALVVARCEYHPSADCPQTRITGVPGSGPETRTANELLADAQRELDNALAARDGHAPELDATIARQEQALRDAQNAVVAEASRGLGALWVAMNDLTSANAGAMTLRLLTIGVCVLCYLAPLIFGWWRGETTHERRAAARAERERAELDADTAIAIKRAEVRREAEILWAEHQLTQARLAIEAQTAIDREQQRRRVAEALADPEPVPAQRAVEAPDEVFLPIAAEAEAASLAITQTRAPQNLPAPLPAGGELQPSEQRDAPLIPRWIRPLVPPFVARVIDTSTAPLRTARQVFEGVLEETEEITFALRRTRKVTVNSAASDTTTDTTAETPSANAEFAGSPRQGAGDRRVGGSRSSLSRSAGRLSVESAAGDRRPELTEPDRPPELDPPDGPRQLPPPK